MSMALCSSAAPEDLNTGCWSPQTHCNETGPGERKTQQERAQPGFADLPCPTSPSNHLFLLEPGQAAGGSAPHTSTHQTTSQQHPGQRLSAARALRAGRRAAASPQTALRAPRGELQPSSSSAFFYVSAGALRSSVYPAPRSLATMYWQQHTHFI